MDDNVKKIIGGRRINTDSLAVMTALIRSDGSLRIAQGASRRFIMQPIHSRFNIAEYLQQCGVPESTAMYARCLKSYGMIMDLCRYAPVSERRLVFTSFLRSQHDITQRQRKQGYVSHHEIGCAIDISGFATYEEACSYAAEWRQHIPSFDRPMLDKFVPEKPYSYGNKNPLLHLQINPKF